ncbi:MAG: TraX family protein [Eubacteriales bacterium]
MKIFKWNIPGITGSTLKMIAIIAMLIDHIGAVIIAKMLVTQEFITAAVNGEKGGILQELIISRELYDIYYLLRNIGRIGFPIFCFLLVEGFTYTKNKKNYALRLAVFACISEIPFNLGIAGNLFDYNYQNVFFTLLIGLLMMIILEKIECYEQWNVVVRGFYSCVIVGIALVSAEFLNTDYAAYGIMSILLLYIFRYQKWKQIFFGALSFLWESPALAAFIPIAFYNGKRGWNMKYVFYIFYPVHLIVLYGIWQYFYYY